MNEQDKKIAAATAAVFNYIRTEEESACLAAAPYCTEMEAVPAQQTTQAWASPFTAWGMAGRSDLMQGRTLMQMRVFK